MASFQAPKCELNSTLPNKLGLLLNLSVSVDE